ncbi:MAG: sulfite exporter TauE/SafE family protein [Gammaproteobacteria bacterium]|nr:sulfite exporter TauE/SafE family protein [Gammaproteobacteria bacterium]
MLDLSVYLLTGAVAGLFAGLLGVGGGLIIVPALIWVFHGIGVHETVVAHLAIGTSLATIIVTSISSIRAHNRRGAVLWDSVLRLAPGIVVGAWLGAAIADWLPTLWLQRVFACFVILVGLQMLLGAHAEARRAQPGPVGMFAAGTVIGTLSSIVGIGGGSLTVPFLSWCSVDMRRAVATSAACGLPIALAGTLGFVVAGWGIEVLPSGSSGYVYWPAFAAIAVASYLSAPAGAKLAHTLPLPTLKRVFAMLLLVVGTKMLLG